jgi:hypothetical protein
VLSLEVAAGPCAVTVEVDDDVGDQVLAGVEPESAPVARGDDRLRTVVDAAQFLVIGDPIFGEAGGKLLPIRASRARWRI